MDSDAHPSRGYAGDTRARGAGLPEQLLAAGVCLFGIGAVAAIATLLPLFLSWEPLPTGVYLLAVTLAPLGLALCLLSLLAGVRRRRRTVQQDLSVEDSASAA